MAVYKFKDDDIEHNYNSETGFDWPQAAWVTVSILGAFLPVVVFVGMLFDFW